MSDRNEGASRDEEAACCPFCSKPLERTALRPLRAWTTRATRCEVLVASCGRCGTPSRWMSRSAAKPADDRPAKATLELLATPSHRGQPAAPISDDEARRMVRRSGQIGPADASTPPGSTRPGRGASRPPRPRKSWLMLQSPARAGRPPTRPLGSSEILRRTQCNDAAAVISLLGSVDPATCDLPHAVSLGLLERVRALLADPGLDVNEPDGLDRTPFQYAAVSRYLHALPDGRLEAVVDLLVSAGADPFASSSARFWEAPTWWCLRHRDLRIWKRLQFAPDRWNDALVMAIRHRCLEAADLVVEACGGAVACDLGALLPDRVRDNHPAGVRWLLEHGMDANAADEQGRTALHHAARRGWPDRHLQMLLDHGADLDARDARGATPLQLAERRNRHTAILFLRRAARG